MDKIDEAENEARMLRGELYLPKSATDVIMRATGSIRPGRLPEESFIIDDKKPMPPPGTTEEEEAVLFKDDAYIDGPIKVDYGTNLRIGKGVYINFNCTFLDTCLITIGSRTLIGPGCSFFAATHPLDPFLRNGINGPELGGPITIGEDCWFGGNVTVCPNVTVGRGVTVGAGSVVTKDVPDFHVVAGNPARIIKRIEPKQPDPTLLASEVGEAVVAAAGPDRS
ncbi:unnamed protein product [Diplocarpon coronariae]|uniref:Uncharacterized protein n=1 Tax=Diplocarpon coronariae TaxID=2795749 RepID=A0A218ZH91_9HELO|nr:hypothetical protein B2J93_4980 [Marssonina coronariae]